MCAYFKDLFTENYTRGNDNTKELEYHVVSAYTKKASDVAKMNNKLLR